MRPSIAASVCLACLISLSCGEVREEEKKDASPHAAAGVVPGSHEDWCGEHAVPESQCTRCNPELIAAFRATGDWCEEHGLPESQCLACNPDLKIERPPSSEAH
jgi:hypothetical protein